MCISFDEIPMLELGCVSSTVKNTASQKHMNSNTKLSLHSVITQDPEDFLLKTTDPSHGWITTVSQFSQVPNFPLLARAQSFMSFLFWLLLSSFVQNSPLRSLNMRLTAQKSCLTHCHWCSWSVAKANSLTVCWHCLHLMFLGLQYVDFHTLSWLPRFNFVKSCI